MGSAFLGVPTPPIVEQVPPEENKPGIVTNRDVEKQENHPNSYHERIVDQVGLIYPN